jgi:predicted Zn-dependent protease
VYRFISIGPGGNQADAETVLSAILNSFRAVAPNDLVRFPPLRLKVLTAKSGDTVESLAKRMAVSGDRENAFRILNGLSPGDRVQAGQQVKIAQ